MPNTQRVNQLRAALRQTQGQITSLESDLAEAEQKEKQLEANARDQGSKVMRVVTLMQNADRQVKGRRRALDAFKVALSKAKTPGEKQEKQGWIKEYERKLSDAVEEYQKAARGEDYLRSGWETMRRMSDRATQDAMKVFYKLKAARKRARRIARLVKQAGGGA